ncbi:MAG: hypothetical protein COB02_16670 [Candidatus Cloacimonadota bacterium]|nr:MAG: hypothetical protein COB02_16670 [Candidatus Cloacimonadota bacterium]
MNQKNIPFGLSSIFFITIIVAFCSIVYELLLAQTLTVILGGNVVRYSITIGLYLFFLGIGALSCEKPKEYPLKTFILLEIILSITGAFSVVILFYLSTFQFSHPYFFLFISHAMIAWIGFLSGMEIPLLTQILGGNKFARILGFDYFGSLIGTIVFALYLHSELGLVTSSFVIATLNLFVAIACLIKSDFKLLKVFSVILLIIFSVVLYFSQNIQNYLRFFYQNSYISSLVPNSKIRITNVIQTKYQTITEGHGEVFNKEGVSFFKDHFIFLDKGLQLGTTWFKPYHQAFATGGLLYQNKPKLDILILGGGDLLLAQDLLGSGRVKHIDLVDIDQEFINYLKVHPYYSRYNQYAHSSKNVKIHVKDAFLWVRKKAILQKSKYDLIFIDFASLKESDKGLHLYSQEFFTWCNQLLNSNGAMLSWVYDSKNHKKIMTNLFFESNFKYKKEYKAYTMKHLKEVSYSPDIDNTFVQTFWILSKSDISNFKNLRGFSSYQKLLYKTVLNESWITLKANNKKVNSIFKPNYNLIVSNKK